MAHAEIVPGDYLMTVHQRTLDDVRAIVPDPVQVAASDRRFAAAHVSQVNLALYRRHLQPWVGRSPRSWPTRCAPGTRCASATRCGPTANLLAPLGRTAGRILRADRKPVGADNPWELAEACSDAITHLLQVFSQSRDEAEERAFGAVTAIRWCRRWRVQPDPPRRCARTLATPRIAAYGWRKRLVLRVSIEQGGPPEATVAGR